MKIAFLSDIHTDINKNYPIISSIPKNQFDVLVLAGDLCEGAANSIDIVNRLEDTLKLPVYFVPGNHDYWTSHKYPSLSETEKIYQTFVRDPRCLCEKSIILHGNKKAYALIGNSGWYDYSFGSSEFSKEAFDSMTYMGRTWQDHYYNAWAQDNKKQNEFFLSSLQKQMEEHKDLAQILVTHMVPIPEFTVPEEYGEMWRFFNAFLGSSSYEKLYQNYPVSYAICGHVHFRGTVKKGNTEYICPCFNYHTEWKNVLSSDSAKEIVSKQLKDAIHVIEI